MTITPDGDARAIAADLIAGEIAARGWSRREYERQGGPSLPTIKHLLDQDDQNYRPTTLQKVSLAFGRESGWLERILTGTASPDDLTVKGTGGNQLRDWAEMSVTELAETVTQAGEELQRRLAEQADPPAGRPNGRQQPG